MACFSVSDNVIFNGWSSFCCSNVKAGFISFCKTFSISSFVGISNPTSFFISLISIRIPLGLVGLVKVPPKLFTCSLSILISSCICLNIGSSFNIAILLIKSLFLLAISSIISRILHVITSFICEIYN